MIINMGQTIPFQTSPELNYDVIINSFVIILKCNKYNEYIDMAYIQNIRRRVIYAIVIKLT